MNKYKAVIFDFDGTLMNTNDVILKSWRHVYKALRNRECRDEEVTPSFGEPLEETMRKHFPEYDSEIPIQIYRDYQVKYFSDEIQLFPGVKDMIIGLKEKGYLLGVVTSRVWSSTEVGLYKFDIADYFDAFVTCEDSAAHKPNPEPLLIGMKKLGVNKDEAIYVGDSQYDIQCAHNAGVKAVLCDWTICLPESERVGLNKPDYVITKAEELYDIV